MYRKSAVTGKPGVEVTMTATLRPEIIRKTAKTFAQRLFEGRRYPIILNVDPVGPATVYEAIKSVEDFFEIRACRVPREASFARAFKWCWEMTTEPYVFHLEDDWLLAHNQDFPAMLRAMEAHEDLAALRLPWKPAEAEGMKNWRHWFPWNGEFFECPKKARREVGFCGHPSLLRGEFMRRTARHLDPEKNPEKQFHHGPKALLEEVSRWSYGVWSVPDGPRVIYDLGRKWMIENGYAKEGIKAFFTRWERKEEEPDAGRKTDDRDHGDGVERDEIHHQGAQARRAQVGP